MSPAADEPTPIVMELLTPCREEAFCAFLERLRANGDGELFFPHPLSREAGEQIARRTGRDIYLVALRGERVVGYGMLRGWDEGYDVPSLGLAVDPSERHTFLARRLYRALVVEARKAGATAIRANVKASRSRLVAAGRTVGFDFSRTVEERSIGYKPLQSKESR